MGLVCTNQYDLPISQTTGLHRKDTTLHLRVLGVGVGWLLGSSLDTPLTRLSKLLKVFTLKTISLLPSAPAPGPAPGPVSLGVGILTCTRWDHVSAHPGERRSHSVEAKASL